MENDIHDTYTFLDVINSNGFWKIIIALGSCFGFVQAYKPKQPKFISDMK